MRTILVLIFTFTVSCTDMDSQKRPSRPVVGARPIPLAKVIESHKTEWMRIAGVNGVGETEKDGKPAVLILVDTLTKSLKSKLPSKADGYAIVIDEIGVVRPLPR